VVLLESIAILIIGILLLTNTAATTVIVIQALGLYWLITGVIDLVRIFLPGRTVGWGWLLFSGIIGIIAGILILQHPWWAAILVPTTLIWVMGFFGIFIGIVGLVQAFQGAGWGAGILGALSIIFGIILIANPLVAAIGLPFVVGIFAIVGGIMGIFAAFRLR
jgi:uncharacterized membrane protein HdeD (DUF308 family)